MISALMTDSRARHNSPLYTAGYQEMMSLPGVDRSVYNQF
jgi:hypothetical protein